MIEVRAWDKTNKKMIKVDEIILMRKSDYKDKNGNYIYEGDKLKYVNEYNEIIISKCVYKKREIPLTTGEIAKIEGFYFINSDFNINKYVGRVLNETEVIVIGNLEITGHIYEA